MSTQQPSTKTSQSYSVLDTQVLKRWLLLARGIWLTLVILTLSIFFASLPVYIALLRTPCVEPACGYQQLSPEKAATLEGIGLFPGVFIVFSVACTFILLVMCLAVSMVIVWRRPDDRMAFIVALFLVTLSPFNVMFNVSASPSPLQVPNECLNFLFVTLLPLILVLFPSGHFVPRWMRWPVIAFLVVQAPSIFYQAFASLNISAVSIGFLVNIGMCAILVVAQLYRFRRVSSPLERQQTKWVVFGFAVFITWDVVGIVPYLLSTGVASPDSLSYPVYSAVPRSWQLSVRHYVMKWTWISSGSSCWASLKRRCSHRMFRCGYVLLNHSGNRKRGRCLN